MSEKPFHQSDVDKFQVDEEVLPLADLSHEVGKESAEVLNCFIDDLEPNVTIKLVTGDRIYYLENDESHDCLLMYSSKDMFDDAVQITKQFSPGQPIAAVGAEATFQKKLSGQYFMTHVINQIFILKPKQGAK